MNAERPGISVILPAHNEKDIIYEMVRETVGVLEGMGWPYEILVVDDGSTDGTQAEIRRALNDFQRVSPVELPVNRGKGHALRHGFHFSSMDLVCFLDADLDIHPSLMERLLGKMSDTDADIVIGSKRHPQSVLVYPWFRKLYSMVYYLLVLTLFRLPVRDTQTGIKLFRREVLERVFPRIICKHYALDLELLVVAHKLGYRIAEAPIVMNANKKYSSNIRWSDIRGIVIDTLAVFYRLYFLRYYSSPLKAPAGEEPSITVVIPTKDVDPMVLECLEKCCALEYGSFDILLVPDHPVDAELPDTHVRVIPTGPVGPSHKRNLAVGECDSDIVAFIDGDAWPEPDWLRNAAPYFADEGVAAVCGPAVTPDDDSRAQQVSGCVYSSSLVSGNTTFRYSYHAMREVDDYPSCNLLVRRSDFEKAGGFPEEYWPGEDTVLCMRLTHEQGKKIIYVPNVVVYHHRRPVYVPHLRQVYSYAKHRGHFVRKFPQTSRRPAYFVPSIFLVFLIAGLGISIFSQTFRLAYLSVVGFYLLLALLSSVKTLEPVKNLLIFPGIIATNITYGAGLIIGLLTKGMGRR